ncbi:MAG: hypothetical protein K0U98_00875 [Deltaproteobacteria bacterium]|nr:hypothetical protein [Deltaproteobacteria bacterium]
MVLTGSAWHERALDKREENFLQAAEEVQTPSNPAEICLVLNHLSSYTAIGREGELVADVDALMEKLYQEKRLVVPSHRWASTQIDSIRGHLVGLYEGGHIRWDALAKVWEWEGCTSFFYVRDRQKRALAQRLRSVIGNAVRRLWSAPASADSEADPKYCSREGVCTNKRSAFPAMANQVNPPAQRTRGAAGRHTVLRD